MDRVLWVNFCFKQRIIVHIALEQNINTKYNMLSLSPRKLLFFFNSQVIYKRVSRRRISMPGHMNIDSINVVKILIKNVDCKFTSKRIITKEGVIYIKSRSNK